MKKIISYLKTHLKEDFHLGFYTTILIFLIAAFAINYRYDFKNVVLDSQENEIIKLSYYFLFFAFAYYVPTLFYAVFHRQYDFLKSPAFWGVTLFILLTLAYNRNAIYLSRKIIEWLDVPRPVFYFLWKCLLNLIRTITMFLPILFFKLIFDREQPTLYGLTWRDFDPKPYLLMLLIMVPLIVWASYQPAFLKMYPRYKPGAAERFLSQPHLLTLLIFQITYALRFVTVELFFRGFMVLGVQKFMGRSVIIPMVVLYAFWHFGKPMGEAIGSIFGGYILGVIALESRTVMGGVFVHIGVALLMEWTAYAQLYG